MTNVTMEQSQDFINSQKTKGLMENLNAIKEEIKATVTDTKVADTVTNTIDDQKAKISACIKELVRRGKESEVGKFVMKCLENLKQMLSALVGHIKDLWARILAMFKKAEVTEAPVVIAA